MLLPYIILGKKSLLIAFAYMLQVIKESFKLYRATCAGITDLLVRVHIVSVGLHVITLCLECSFY